MRVPQPLLDRHAYQIRFYIDHNNFYLHLKDVDKDEFHTRPLHYYLLEEALHKEVMSWPGVKKL